MSAESVNVAELLELLKVQSAQLANLQAEAEAARKAEELRQNDGYTSGIHPLGFPCLVKPDSDPDNVFQVFRVPGQGLTGVLCLPRQVKLKSGKTAVYGPELLIMQGGIDLAYNAPTHRDCLAGWIGLPSGGESSKLRQSKDQTPTYWLASMLARSVDCDRYYVSGYDGEVSKEEFTAIVQEEYLEWFDNLNPAKTSIQARQSRLVRLTKR